MGEYRKPRVTVGAVEVGDASNACLSKLSAKLPAVANLFVMVPDDDVAAKFQSVRSVALPRSAGERVRLIIQHPSQPSPEGKPGPGGGRLRPELVRHFEAWMDHGLSGAVQEHLDAGQCVVFVQVSNSEEETGAYRTIGQYCVGGVQLHDLPA